MLPIKWDPIFAKLSKFFEEFQPKSHFTEFPFYREDSAGFRAESQQSHFETTFVSKHQNLNLNLEIYIFSGVFCYTFQWNFVSRIPFLGVGRILSYPTPRIPFYRIPILPRGLSKFSKTKIPFYRIPILSGEFCTHLHIWTSCRSWVLSKISMWPFWWLWASDLSQAVGNWKCV